MNDYAHTKFHNVQKTEELTNHFSKQMFSTPDIRTEKQFSKSMEHILRLSLNPIRSGGGGLLKPPPPSDFLSSSI